MFIWTFDPPKSIPFIGCWWSSYSKRFMNATTFRKISPKEDIPPTIVNNPKTDLQIWMQALFCNSSCKNQLPHQLPLDQIYFLRIPFGELQKSIIFKAHTKKKKNTAGEFKLTKRYKSNRKPTGGRYRWLLFDLKWEKDFLEKKGKETQTGETRSSWQAF